MTTQKNPLELARQHCGTMSNTHVGSTFFSFRLIVLPGELIDKVTGMVHIMRDPQDEGKNVTFNVTGTYYPIGKIVTLHGEFLDYCKPPAECVYLKQFEAHMQVDENWKGKGGFKFGNITVDNCIVTPLLCELK